MGIIGNLLNLIFGGGRNVVVETAGAFLENAEAGAERGKNVQLAAMAAHSAEFYPAQRGWFDRAMDGVNRLPRPMMALGCLGLVISAMVNPVWFAERMAGIALVPEPLWWLLGGIVSFYFGARHQVKGQEFQRSIAHTMGQVPTVVENLHRLQSLRPREGNPALLDWRKTRG
ncbi:Holin of 3TMs, for gene-transfer release [Shimia gijangensis]|uniref:Holin of 3TMs, for gene-transfer release n=1 Tax=Shimia gijangensis TaxID=1470563 RepID=A0A1M6ERF7_9RHOB|nr:holin family protein [Shimia gijangensis]SHI87959.1 Holin of 3TMs, for gene-transfer release [Shimia gijangensis]